MSTPLNNQQRAAVERTDQDVCVVAGPGSGKTRVLTERFAWLVEQGTPPENILTVTFTEKAAREIKGRLLQRLGGDAELRGQVERSYVSTIHGFCTRLLRENAVAAGVDIGFGVLDEADSHRLARQAAVQVLDELLAARPGEVRRLMESVAVSSRKTESVPDLPGVIVGVYDAMRAAGDHRNRPPVPQTSGPALGDVIRRLRDATAAPVAWRTDNQRRSLESILAWIAEAERTAPSADTRQQLAALANLPIDLRYVPKAAKPELRNIRGELVPLLRAGLLTEHYAALRALLWDALERLDELYRDAKLAVASLDFSDLEERALELLDSSPAVSDRVRAQFHYILMDELQDTNPLQWRILDRIRRPERFFGVGDINQSIYGFRHADPGVFAAFEQSTLDRGDTVDRLETNYRTRQEILDAIAWIVRDEPGIVPPRLVSGGEFNDPPGPPTEIFVAHGADRDDAARREARWIARRIARFAAGGARLHQIAVLGRKMRLLEPIAEALRESGIASITTGGQTLYETRESRDLFLMLNVLGNATDEVSLAGLLRSPLVGCRDETLLRLRLLRPSLWTSIDAVADGGSAGFADEELERLRWFHSRIAQLRGHPGAAPDVRVARFLDASGYLDGLDAQGRANVERFLRRLRDRFQGSGQSLAAVAAEMQQLRDEAPEPEAPPAEASDAVSLMSIHASKGLEFPIVFVPALSSSPPNDLDPICRSPEDGIAVRWRDPETGANHGDLAYEAVKGEQSARQLAEEWRLLFVAMTRAERHLVLSWPAAERSRGSDWSSKIAKRLGLPDSAPGSEIIADKETAARVLYTTLSGDDLPSDQVHARPAAPTPPAALAPPRLTGQHDAVAAVTEIAAFAECPRQYYLRHYLGFEVPPPASGGDAGPAGGAEIGVQVHRLLAGLHVDDAGEEALRLVTATRENELVRRAGRAATSRREYGFNVAMEDVVVRGQIDLWFEEAGEQVIADYKTDRFDPDLEPERMAPYQFQLRLYALALEQLHGRLPDRAALLFVRHGRSVDVSLVREELGAAKAVVGDLRRAQQSLNFPLRQGERCRRCPFLDGLCPARLS